jgi:serine/threonine protein kinase
MNDPDLKPDNILLGLPDNHDRAIEKFLASLDPSQDTSGPITIARPNVDMLDIRLTDLDLGEPFSDILTNLLTLDLSCGSSLSQNNRHHSFQIQPQALRAPEVILGTTWGLPADIWNLGCLVRCVLLRHLYHSVKHCNSDIRNGHIKVPLPPRTRTQRRPRSALSYGKVLG